MSFLYTLKIKTPFERVFSWPEWHVETLHSLIYFLANIINWLKNYFELSYLFVKYWMNGIFLDGILVNWKCVLMAFYFSECTGKTHIFTSYHPFIYEIFSVISSQALRSVVCIFMVHNYSVERHVQQRRICFIILPNKTMLFNGESSSFTTQTYLFRLTNFVQEKILSWTETFNNKSK
jgi:hypothetical protein